MGAATRKTRYSVVRSWMLPEPMAVRMPHAQICAHEKIGGQMHDEMAGSGPVIGGSDTGKQDDGQGKDQFVDGRNPCIHNAKTNGIDKDAGTGKQKQAFAVGLVDVSLDRLIFFLSEPTVQKQLSPPGAPFSQIGHIFLKSPLHPKKQV